MQTTTPPYWAAPLLDALDTQTDPEARASLLRRLALCLPPSALPAAGTAPPAPDWAQMVRERRYEDALELITAEYLNNPEKSIYFASQIRFLKKLIYNASKI